MFVDMYGGGVVTPLRQTLVSSSLSKCASCR